MNIYRHIIIALLALVSFFNLAGEQVNKKLPAVDVKDVRIENLRGKVIIQGWDQGFVSVEGELDDKAEGIIFEKNGSEIFIKVAMSKHFNNKNWRGGGSNLTVKMPKALRVAFKGVSSDVTVKNINKSSQIKTVSGDINVADLSGYIELSSVNGNIYSKNLAGKIELSTISGDINDQKSAGRLVIKTVSGSVSSDSLAKEIKANCVSGSIDLTLASIDQLDMSTVSGEVKAKLLLNASGIVKVSSVSGDIDLDFLGETNANFRLSANAGGDLINKLTNDSAKRSNYHSSAKLNFVTGNGRGSVRGSTVSGTLKVSD